ncbi:MAG: biotin/lipoyl-binding protein, partial [Bacteroidales bacterium]|nr:biotin/lipoyl-binding protein [Bacteroidales bacterium]
IHVDFNDKVSRGQILAELDKTALQASLDNARASLDEAKFVHDLLYR